MKQDHHPGIFLETLRLKCMDGEWPSNSELKTLVRLCSLPAERFREASLTLLLQPPVADELAYNRYLMGFLMGTSRKIRQFPPSLLERICELVAMSGKLSEEPGMRLFFIRVLKNLPKSFVRNLYDQAFPLEPFIHHIPLKSLLVSPRLPALVLKRRWRLFRKRLRQSPAPPSWAQLTFSDLANLFKGKGSGHHQMIPSGRWLLYGRPLVFPPTTTNTAPSGPPLERSFWPGGRTATLRYFDHLLSWQAEELRSVRELAQRVSQSTRRVVLSWHNATLAASGGWAFENLCESFPLKSVWTGFKKNVRERMKDKNQARDGHPSTAENLGELWKERLVIPKIHRILWEEKMLATFDPSHQAQLEKHLEAASRILHRSDMESMLVKKGYGWPGAVGPHQRSSLHDISGWCSSRRRVWTQGLLRLAALIHEGQLLLDKGSLSHLVLPWIDKFFISSRREEDWEYLVTLVQWLERQGTQPLILFWEDTPHACEPSLKLALRNLSGQGLPYRGVGVFDWQGSQRTDAVQIIGNEHQKVLLFALRPFTDGHNFRPLQQLLGSRDYSFFRDYDSSWKDGLCFLYAGTQVFPLLSVQSEMENFPAWIGVGGVKVPFGTYIRAKLREAVLGKGHIKGDAFSREYALWANLC